MKRWKMALRSRFLVPLIGLVATVLAGAILASALNRRTAGDLPEPPVAQGLFAVPVESYVSRETTEFDRRLRAAQDAGEAWVHSPLWIALGYLGDPEGSLVGIIQVGDAAEMPRRSTVTVIREGLLDDSVRAVWNEFRLDRDEAGKWELVELREAYRCRRGPHQESFSAELCL